MRVISLSLSIADTVTVASPATATEPIKKGNIAYAVFEFPANSQETKVRLKCGGVPVIPFSPEEDAVGYITLDDRCQWFRIDHDVNQSCELEFEGWNDGGSGTKVVNCILSVVEDYT